MSNFSSQSFFNLVFVYAGVFLGFINTILKTKVFSTEEIGVVTITTTLSIFLVFLISYGFLSGTRRFYSRFKDNVAEKTGFIIINLLVSLILYCFASVIFFLLKSFILEKYNNLLFERYFNAVFLFFIGNLLTSFFQYIFESEYRSLLGNIYYDIIHRILHFLVLIYMLNTNSSFYWYIFFLVISLFLNILFYLAMGFKLIKLGKPSFAIITRSFIIEYLKYCSLTFSSGMTGLVTENIDKVMIGAYLSMSDLGIYSIVVQIAMLIKIMKNGFIRIAYPSIAEAWEKKDSKKIQNIYKENSAIQIFLGSFIFVFIFPKQIMSVLSPEYIKGSNILIVISFAYLLDLSTGMSEGIISLSRYYYFDLFLRILLVLLTIITNIIMIPFWGLLGAAAATTLTILIYNILKLMFIKIKFSMNPFSFDTIKIIFLILFIGFCFFFLLKKINIELNIFNIIFLFIIVFILYVIIGKNIIKISFLNKIKICNKIKRKK